MRSCQSQKATDHKYFDNYMLLCDAVPAVATSARSRGARPPMVPLSLHAHTQTHHPHHSQGMAARKLSSNEAAELVALLTATPAAERATHWPPLLTLLTRWAAQPQAAVPQQAAPARPWERKQPTTTANTALQQQQHHQHQHQQLLKQAATVVHQALHDMARNACNASTAAVAALGQLFVPSVHFLAAALGAAPGECCCTLLACGAAANSPLIS